jgi:hypothetical protein
MVDATDELVVCTIAADASTVTVCSRPPTSSVADRRRTGATWTPLAANVLKPANCTVTV